MANYFEMGRALTGSYHAGLATAKERQLREEAAARQAEEHDLRMQGLRRQRSLEQEQDTAFREFTGISQNGIVNAEGTGLSQPSAQFIASGNAGFGAGERAVQEAAGMYQREMGRFAQAPAAPAGGLPKYDATAPVTRRDATDIEQEQALGRVAAAQRDARGIRESGEKVKQLKFDEGYKTYADGLIKDMRDLGPKAFIGKHGAALNANGNVDGYMTFDEKSGKVAVATKNGIDLMDPADVLAYQLGAYKLGNGKVEQGIALMTGASDRNQKRITDALATARDVIKTQVGAWKAGEDVKNDAARTAAYRAGINARGGGKGEREVPSELLKQMNDIAVKLGDPKLPPAERAALTAQLRAFQGQAATHLGKTLGMPVPPNRDEDMKQAVELVKAGAAPTVQAAMMQLQAARSGVNPADEAVARLQQMNANAGAARGQSTPRTNVTAPMPMREVRPGASRPEDFLRTSKRGLFGGLSYVYVDPVTGEEYSAEKYDQLLGGR